VVCHLANLGELCWNCSWACVCKPVMHLSVKFGADIFIQSGVIAIFPKFKMAAAAILDLCSVPNWVKIYAMVIEIDALMLQMFI